MLILDDWEFPSPCYFYYLRLEKLSRGAGDFCKILETDEKMGRKNEKHGSRNEERGRNNSKMRGEEDEMTSGEEKKRRVEEIWHKGVAMKTK